MYNECNKIDSVLDAINDLLTRHAANGQTPALRSMLLTLARAGGGVALDGYVVGVLDVLSDYDASGWLSDQQTRLHEQVGMLALRETRELAERARLYTDYGVDVRQLVAEC